MNTDIEQLLTPDCENCQALCCLALALDAGDSFAIDKPAGLPCPNLTSNNQCRIYENLDAAGFSGCTRYNCLGAGQWVCALYGRRTWKIAPDSTPAIIRDFATARALREALQLLHAARHLPLTGPQKTERTALCALLAPAPEKTRALYDSWHGGRLKARHQAFLISLRGTVSR